jgi:hypothetical protein
MLPRLTTKKPIFGGKEEWLNVRFNSFTLAMNLVFIIMRAGFWVGRTDVVQKSASTHSENK